MKLPFETIQEFAYDLVFEIASNQVPEYFILLNDHLEDYLNLCGWTVKEFEEELMIKIDNNWEQYLN